MKIDGKTNLPNYPDGMLVVRRRFQDFAFVREHLVKNFPACVVPPIPEKHRLGKFAPWECHVIHAHLVEYIKGDRFSPEFVERRRLE